MFDKSDKYFSVAAEMIRSLSRFALGIAIARWAGPDAYGTLILMVTVEVVLQTVTSALWVTPMASIAPGEREPERSRLMLFALRRHWAWSAGTAVVAGGLLLANGAQGVTVAQGCAFVLAVFACGGLNGTRARLSTSFRSRDALRTDLWATVMPLVSVGSAWFMGGDVVLTYWLSRGTGALLSARAMHSRVPIEASGEPEQSERLTVMGRHMGAGSIAYSVCSRVHPFVLAAVTSTHQVGLFGAASTLTGPLRMGTMALSGALRPRLALHFGSGERELGWAMAKKVLGAMAIISAIGILAAVLLGAPVTQMIFGDEFTGLAVVLIFAAGFAGLASFNSILVVVIQVAVNAATTAKMRFGAGILSLTTVAPCSLYFGVRGAFASLIVTEIAYAVAGAWVLVTHERQLLQERDSDSTKDPDATSQAAA